MVGLSPSAGAGVEAIEVEMLSLVKETGLKTLGSAAAVFRA